MPIIAWLRIQLGQLIQLHSCWIDEQLNASANTLVMQVQDLDIDFVNLPDAGMVNQDLCVELSVHLAEVVVLQTWCLPRSWQKREEIKHYSKLMLYIKVRVRARGSDRRMFAQ
jgi:hypothetical protein